MIDDVKQWIHAAAPAGGLILTDQVIQVIRILGIAAVTWAAVEVIAAGRALAVVQNDVGSLKTEVQRLSAAMEVKSQTAITRLEFERLVEIHDKRIEALEKRMDNHSRAMSAIIEGRRLPRE